MRLEKLKELLTNSASNVVVESEEVCEPLHDAILDDGCLRVRYKQGGGIYGTQIDEEGARGARKRGKRLFVTDCDGEMYTFIFS